MPNYFNPDSFNPGVDFKPNSALGGMIWAEDRNRYNNLADMFQQGQGYDLAKKGFETSEYFGNAPLRALEGQSKAAGYNADIQTKVPMAQANLQSILGRNEDQSLKNRATRETQPSAIAKTIAENVAGKGDAEVKEYVTGWQKAVGLAAEADQMDPNWRSSGSLPVGIASKLDPRDPMQRNLLRVPNPGKLLSSIVEASPDMIKKMAELRQQGANQMATTKEQGRTQRDVANIQAEWHRADIKMRQEKENAIKKLEMKIAELAELDAKGQLNAEGKKLLQFLLDREFRLKQAGAMVAPGVGAAMIGGETGNRMQGALTGPAQLPSAQPQGNPNTFRNQEELNAAIAQGRLRAGDKVIVNGVSGTLR